MVIVPRIAIVPHAAAAPFIYGIRHGSELGAELLLPTANQTLRLFSEQKIDLALVPSSLVPMLPDAHIVSGYCIGATAAVGAPLLGCNCDPTAIRRLYLDTETDPTSAQLAAWALEQHRKLTPQYAPLPDTLPQSPAEGDAYLLPADNRFKATGSFTHMLDLSAEWTKATRQHLVLAVWVAHKEIDPDLVGRLDDALTAGIEQSYESLLDAGVADVVAAYEWLSHYDYIFDDQKQKSLKKFWALGLKSSLRANPG